MTVSRPDIAISVSHLTKTYRIYKKPSDMLREVIAGKPWHKEFTALSNISFTVNRGEVLGIIGRNGSGKSTLLKILVGTLDKSAGEVLINGRVSAILELGTGFHQEYSGRENIFMGGLCLGMTREEIECKVDQIIDFSELKEVIDQPFRTYSTGMQARLTFATAVSIDPDILIIDEALSVGDAKFQRKCFAKIDEFRNNSKTILFVSHDMNSVSYLCDNVILLGRGGIIRQGCPRDITRLYHKMLFGKIDSTENTPVWSNAAVSKEHEKIKQLALEKFNKSGTVTVHEHEVRYGNKKAEIINFGIINEKGERVSILESTKNYIFFMQTLFYENLNDIVFGVLVRNVRGVDVFGTDTKINNISIPAQKRGNILETRLYLTIWLGPGEYFMTFGTAQSNGLKYDFRYDALQFEVRSDNKLYTTSLVNLDASFNVSALGDIAIETEATGD